MYGIGDELADIVESERRKRDLLDPRSGFADRLQLPQQQVPHFRVRDQVFNEVERRCIKPLQIVKKQRERVLLAREYPEETPENRLEAVLRVLRRQVRDRWLLPDHELQLGNEVDDELTIWTERLA